MKHPTNIPGYPEDFKKLAEDIGNLRYDKLSLFLYELGNKIGNDMAKDEAAGKQNLASELRDVSFHLSNAAESTEFAWDICEPFMEKA